MKDSQLPKEFLGHDSNTALQIKTAAKTIMSRATRALLGAAFAMLLGSGCIKSMAVNALADQLSTGTSSTFASDEDIALIGDAVPLALKLMETIVESAPDHVALHQALSSGFTQYAMVYVWHPAELEKQTNRSHYKSETLRASRLFLRAQRYGLAGLEIRHPGFAAEVLTAPDVALSDLEKEDVPLLYWSATSWLGAISANKADIELVGQLPIPIAMLDRALALDETWDKGAIHDLMISVEPQRAMPGWEERCQAHFDRAVELSGGQRPSPYLSMASAVSVPKQRRDQFEALIEKAMAIDVYANPNELTANLFYQQRAELLLSQIDDLFI